MGKKMYYHTRHIPERQLNLETPMGAEVKNNGLCDVLEEPFYSCMKEYSIDVIETRCVWYEIEPEPGVYDFSKLRADVEAIRNKGFGVGVFPWFMHPPKWEKEITRARCLEHGEDSNIISLWDNRTLETYDRLYEALKNEMGDEIDFLYVCIYGDFGEPQYPHNTKHYIFSPKHAHFGLWSGDPLARADFKRFLKEKYSTIAELNTAWQSDYASFDEDLMVWREDIGFKMDYQKWYTDSLMDFTDKACAVARKHFPNTRMGMPIGCKSDSLCFGQTKSTVSKICAKYNIVSRCTTLADFSDYAHSNVVTRRIATASQFYGADYGVESPLTLEKSTAYTAVYQIISSNTVLVHNDPGNIYRARDVYFKYRDLKEALPFKCEYAAFYSVEGEKCMHPCGLKDFAADVKNDSAFYPVEMFDELAKLRKCVDFDIIDEVLIEDGFLKSNPKVVLIRNIQIAKSTAEKISEYEKNGGEVYYIESAPPVILETGEIFICGKPVDDYTAFGTPDGKFYTDHGDRISVFDEENCEIYFNSLDK